MSGAEWLPVPRRMRVAMRKLSIYTGTGLVTLLIVCYAQFPVQVPSNATQNASGVPAGWYPLSGVTAYIDTNAYPEGSPGYQAVAQGLQNAFNAYASSNSLAPTLSIVPSGSAPIGDNTIWVTSNWAPGGDFNANGDNSYSVYWPPNPVTAVVTSSTITMNATIGDMTLLQESVSHEASHNFFLGDCPSCPAQSTIMTYQGYPPAPTGADTGWSSYYSMFGDSA